MLDWLLERLSNYAEEERRANIFAAIGIVFFGISYGLLAWLLDESALAAIIALVVSVSATSLLLRRIRHFAEEKNFDIPSSSPLHQMSRYDLTVEAEIARRIGDATRIELIAAEIRRRESE